MSNESKKKFFCFTGLLGVIMSIIGLVAAGIIGEKAMFATLIATNGILFFLPVCSLSVKVKRIKNILFTGGFYYGESENF